MSQINNPIFLAGVVLAALAVFALLVKVIITLARAVFWKPKIHESRRGRHACREDIWNLPRYSAWANGNIRLSRRDCAAYYMDVHRSWVEIGLFRISCQMKFHIGLPSRSSEPILELTAGFAYSFKCFEISGDKSLFFSPGPFFDLNLTFYCLLFGWLSFIENELNR